jgi:hypothetical protein
VSATARVFDFVWSHITDLPELTLVPKPLARLVNTDQVAEEGCKSTVRFSPSFSTITFCAKNRSFRQCSRLCHLSFYRSTK